jgi:SAM-dependent methyltransferase
MTAIHGIKAGYAHRVEPAYYHDQDGAIVYQPHVYALAAHVAERAEAVRIIDVGCGSGGKLVNLSHRYNLVGVDTAANLARLRERLPQATAIDADLERGIPARVKELAEGCVVICSDVVEHLRNPRRLLEDLREVSSHAACVLISTPDRVRARGVGDLGPPANDAHTREWSIEEFDWLLRDVGFDRFLIGHTVNADTTLWKSTILAIAGTTAAPPRPAGVPPCLAIVAVHNDVDILEAVLWRLLSEGVDVHVIDDWSSDGSYEVVQQIQTRLAPSRLRLERFGGRPGSDFEWAGILRRKEEVATEASAYDWILHQDSDEIRETPWKGLNLAEGLAAVGELGFNAVDHTVLDFRPVADAFARGEDPVTSFRFCEFGRRPGHFLQVKAWLRAPAASSLDLVASGGHEAAFPGRRVFPFKFLMRHYPLRSTAQATAKTADRLRRSGKERAERQWHMQYDAFQEAGAEAFVWDRARLLPFNPRQFESEYLVERLSGIGLR